MINSFSKKKDAIYTVKLLAQLSLHIHIYICVNFAQLSDSKSDELYIFMPLN